MAKDKNNKPVEAVVVPVAVAPIDYTTYTAEALLEAIGKAFAAKEMKLMGALSKLYTKKEGEAEKLKKDALVAELVAKTAQAKTQIDAFIQDMIDSKEYDGAEGFWYAKDFGEVESTLKLTKSARKASVAGESSGKSSYVANPAKSADLLAQVGANVMFEEDTEVTIDKVAQTISAGTTFKEAYDYSTNGGWRNRVRMALLKEAGIIS
jgi:hypothetical protein